MMKLLFSMLLLLAVPAGATTIADVQKAFAATRTMEADFRQVGGDGKIAEGRMQLKRPGKVRFDYGPEARQLVVADGRTLSFVDYQVAQVSQWPVRKTPLGLLLDPQADLAPMARVLPASPLPQAGSIAVEAQDPKKPEQGRIILFLEPDRSLPGGLRLTGWQVLDAQNNRTDVALDNVRVNGEIADSAFRFRDPRNRGRPPGRP